MKVALAANRRVDLRAVADHLVRELASLPMEASVALRGPKQSKRPPQPFERLAAELCESIGIAVEWYRPETSGREATFDRDWRLARAATRLVAYINHDTPTDAGTWHLLDAALGSDVEAVVYYSDGEPEHVLVWLGGS